MFDVVFLQFRALGKDQREAILKALNDDAEDLISEYGTDAMRDPDIARLREQMRECNRHFNQLAGQCADDGTCYSLLFSLIIIIKKILGDG